MVNICINIFESNQLSKLLDNVEFKSVMLFSVGAKSQILSSVTPPGRKSWLLF